MIEKMLRVLGEKKRKAACLPYGKVARRLMYCARLWGYAGSCRPVSVVDPLLVCSELLS